MESVIVGIYLGFPAGSVVKNMPANAGDVGSISGSGRSPGEGNGNPVQYSCLENSMNRGAWWATFHGGHEELDMTQHTHAHTGNIYRLTEKDQVTRKCIILNINHHRNVRVKGFPKSTHQVIKIGFKRGFWMGLHWQSSG